MTCFKTRYIVNPSRAWSPETDKPKILSSCGKCPACTNMLQNEWWIRSMYELKSTYQNGGFAALPTLTYRNEDLPRYFYDYKEGNMSMYVSRSVPCFNPEHINKFFNSLRKHFERIGIVGGLKYIINGEYGSRNTERPHYHPIICFDSRYQPYRLQMLQLFRKYWTYGDVRFNPKLGVIVKPHMIEQAANYNSKYTTKDVGYIYGDQKDIKKYREYVGSDEFESVARKYFSLRKNSQFWGKSLVDVVRESPDWYDLLRNGIPLDIKTLDEGKVKRVAIPRYIFDKLCYQTDKVTLFKTLSPFGRMFYEKRFDDDIQETAFKLEFNSTAIQINKAVGATVQVPGYAPSCPVEVSDYLRDLMAGRSYLSLALYKKVFRDFVETSSLDLYDIDNTHILYQKAKNLYINRKTNLEDKMSLFYDLQEYFRDSRLPELRMVVHGDEIDTEFVPRSYENQGYFKVHHNIKEFEGKTYNENPIFEGFDEYLYILDSLSTQSSQRRLAAYNEKRKLAKELKDRMALHDNACLSM